MSAIHEFKCNYCGKRAAAKYNGEHYLAPNGWLQLYDDNLAHAIDQHVCDSCRPQKRKSRSKAKK